MIINWASIKRKVSKGQYAENVLGVSMLENLHIVVACTVEIHTRFGVIVKFVAVELIK